VETGPVAERHLHATVGRAEAVPPYERHGKWRIVRSAVALERRPTIHDGNMSRDVGALLGGRGYARQHHQHCAAQNAGKALHGNLGAVSFPVQRFTLRQAGNCSIYPETRKRLSLGIDIMSLNFYIVVIVKFARGPE
jgi:hypothetical protein